MARTAPREAGSSARPQRTTSPPLEGGEFRAWSPGEDPDDVYPESVEDLQEPSSELFTKDGRPVVFCFYRLTTGQITRVTEQIMVNGGEICPAKHNKRDLCKFGADADVVLAPDTALNHLRTVIYFGSGNPLPEHVGFVRECIQAGKYEHDRLIVRKMPGPPRSNFPRHRNAWTHEDELGLCRYIASVDPYDQGGRCGYEIYKRAIAQHKERGNMPWTTRHSYQSIQEHYRRNEGGLKPMINRFVMQMRPRLDGRGQYERRYVEAIKEEEEEEEGEVEGEVDRSNNDDEETVQRPAKRLRHTAIDLTVSDDDSDSHREQGRGGTASHRGQAPPTAGSSASKSAQVQAEAGSAHENRKSKKKRLRDGHEKRPPVDNIDMADDDQYRPEQEDLRVDFGVDFEDYGAYNELDMQFEAPSTFGLRGQRTGLSPSPSQGAPSTSQVTLVGPGPTQTDTSRTSRIPHGTQGNSQRRVEIREVKTNERAPLASMEPFSIAQAKGKPRPKPRRAGKNSAARSGLTRGPMTRARSRSLSATPASPSTRVERLRHPGSPPLPPVGEDVDAEKDDEDDAAVEVQLLDLVGQSASNGNANTERPHDALDVDDRRTYQTLRVQASQGSYS